jgi:predicted KAP-like P-loop ATPase
MYFSFTLDSENMGKQERDKFIDQLSDKNLTQQTLLDAARIKRLDGSSKAKEYLETFLDYDEEIDSQRAKNALQVLADIGDDLALPGDEAGSFALPAVWRVSYALHHVLARITEDRQVFLVDAFKNGAALALHVFLVRSIKSAKEENVERGPSAVLAELSEGTLEQLQASGVEKIRRSAADGTLLNSERLQSILYFWSEYADADEPKAWLQETLKNKNSLPLILKAFVSNVYSSTGISYRMGFANLSEFLDLELIAPISEELGTADALDSDREREAVRAFNGQYLRFKKGEDTEW